MNKKRKSKHTAKLLLVRKSLQKVVREFSTTKSGCAAER